MAKMLDFESSIEVVHSMLDLHPKKLGQSLRNLTFKELSPLPLPVVFFLQCPFSCSVSILNSTKGGALEETAAARILCFLPFSH